MRWDLCRLNTGLAQVGVTIFSWLCRSKANTDGNDMRMSQFNEQSTLKVPAPNSEMTVPTLRVTQNTHTGRDISRSQRASCGSGRHRG